jgi:hypothetical protein
MVESNTFNLRLNSWGLLSGMQVGILIGKYCEKKLPGKKLHLLFSKKVPVKIEIAP